MSYNMAERWLTFCVCLKIWMGDIRSPRAIWSDYHSPQGNIGKSTPHWHIVSINMYKYIYLPF